MMISQQCLYNVCKMKAHCVLLQFQVLNMHMSYRGIHTSIACILIPIGSCSCVLRCVTCYTEVFC